ncbi:MAG: aldehyde ferredoxin oxidoreductase, partial [Firmicutes bacterium]|nr:aldehyde ferredoxin oxidoreductase [Bacillota bacterium]
MAKILRVDMTRGEARYERVPEAYQALGGRALTSRIVLDEVPAACHPLRRHNKLVFAPGVLSGTAASNSGRLSVGGKSPLTGTIKESNAGGTSAHLLARLGLKAVIVEGFPETDGLHVLHLSAGGAELSRRNDLRLLGSYETARRLREEFGKGCGIILIGPAGERQLSTAGIANLDNEGRPSRVNGRGGLGAVMGSKGLKAIVIDRVSDQPSYHDRQGFTQVLREVAELLRTNPTTGDVYPRLGTAAMVNVGQARGFLPTRNFTDGSFEGAARISGENMYAVIKTRGGEGETTHICMPGCVIRCSNAFPGKEGKEIVAPLEYETLALMGSNLGIDDLDTIARMNWIANDLGVDTIEVGAAIGVAMQAGVASFGDGEAALRLMMDEIGRDTPLGRILGNGAEITGKVFAVTNVPTVKGQSMAAYEPRGLKGTGTTFATSPMGADHTAGNTVRA